MPKVEVFVDEDALEPLFAGEFSFLPRVGDYVSKDAGGYYSYYNVVEVWHREEVETGAFHPCVRVRPED